jgi:hypothetical protein
VNSRKRLILFFVIIITILPGLPASELSNGFIRLILNERNGSFSLLFLTDSDKMRYVPFFNARQPTASFLSVNIDGSIHRLGQSREFTAKVERVNGNPAIVFDSQNLRVTQVFLPVKTENSRRTNGINISITLHNTGARSHLIGLRFLIDTYLGEERGKIPFITSSHLITSEKLIEGNSGERFWISRGSRLSLMGSIINPLDPSAKPPDFVHIANWKRLSEAPWKLRYVEGRSFHDIPYSIGDSAICYYYEPVTIERGRSVTYSILLTTEDTDWYKNIPIIVQPPREIEIPEIPSEEEIFETEEEFPEEEWGEETEIIIIEEEPEITEIVVIMEEPEIEEEPVTNGPTINIHALEQAAIETALEHDENADLVILHKLQDLLDQFIAGEIELNEQDLFEIEGSINRLRESQAH